MDLKVNPQPICFWKYLFKNLPTNKYVSYIEQDTETILDVRDECIIEIHHVLAFLSTMFGKGVTYCTVNSGKCLVATILHIPTYPSINIYKQTSIGQQPYNWNI